MLNLIDPIIYTPKEKNYVNRTLLPLREKAWDNSAKLTKEIKNRISNHTIIAQGGRCAYCETPLLKGSHAIEHIAPKSLYGSFCFEPYNLVTACTSCNSPGNKGETDTIIPPCVMRDYTNNRFKIVHPYFDKPDNHFKYLDDDKTVFDKANCSAKALETINMMHWDEEWAFNQRVRNARTRDIPLDVLQLVNEIATYRV